jgi:hypothetical protein
LTIDIITGERVNGLRTVTFDVTHEGVTERFTATLLAQELRNKNLAFLVRIVHSSGLVIEEREDFQFPRDSATRTQVVTINGVPQMDNDQPAPQHTTQTATAALLASNPLFRWAQAINAAVNNAAATTELTAFRNQQIADVVGTYYLPSRRTWKTETIKILTPMDVLHAVARAAMRKYVRLLAGEAIATDEAFAELAPE